jgi:hypothetical protein
MGPNSIYRVGLQYSRLKDTGQNLELSEGLGIPISRFFRNAYTVFVRIKYGYDVIIFMERKMAGPERMLRSRCSGFAGDLTIKYSH